MKRILLSAFTALTLLTGGQAMAQSNIPQVVNFQAVARDGAGQLVAGQPITVRITIRQNSANGQALYCGTYNATTNAYGSFTVQLNRNAVLTNCNAANGDFAALPWETGAKYVQIEYQGPGSTTFTDVATLEVASVPYAFAASTAESAKTVNTVRTDGATTGQVLTFNSVTGRYEPTTLPAGTTYTAGNGIVIQGGVISNTGDLSTDNEIQTLTLNGQTLALSPNGGSVTLPTGSGTSYWTQTPAGGHIYKNNTGNVGIGKKTPRFPLDVMSILSVSERGDPTIGQVNGGSFDIIDSASNTYMGGVTSLGGATSVLLLRTKTGAGHSSISTLAADRNNGFLALSDSGRARVVATTLSDGTPFVALTHKDLQTAGATETSVQLFGNDDHTGTVLVTDAAGNAAAALFVDPATGQGDIFSSGVKNFRIPHPNKAGQDIWYACVEGPEAAAYTRGTATLVNGKAVISFPEHFASIVAQDGMTIQLTPGSADSKGLAVVKKGTNGFEVRELATGTGNYTFDWEAKAVRKGYENYQPVRAHQTFKKDTRGLQMAPVTK